MDEEVVLALGSNVGDRLEHLRTGVRLLGDAVAVSRLSSVVESAPEGAAVCLPQSDFLNAVVRGRTALEPSSLLRACLRAERAEGRTRDGVGAPRTLDVDVVFFGDRVIREPGLQVPHPRWKERGFVLRPLLDVAPEWTDPESGETVESIFEARAGDLGPARVVAPPSALDPDR